MTWATWTTEAAMVRDFTAWAMNQGWTAYAETGGWDVLLVRDDGFQVGVEAKLSLNAKVFCQVLGHDRGAYHNGVGPDCHAILVPAARAVNGLETIARRLGIVVITGAAPEGRHRRRARVSWDGTVFAPELPEPNPWNTRDEESRDCWPERCPDERIKLPEYLPDVTGGHSAPVQLTTWKIQAIKAAIVLEQRGWITRKDLQALKIDPSRWTQFWLVSVGDKRWAATERLPNFKAQHPTNYEQIKADIAVWGAAIPDLMPAEVPADGQ